MSGSETNSQGQNGSVFGSNPNPSSFGPPTTNNASQPSNTTPTPTPNASVTMSSLAKAGGQQNAQHSQSLFGPPVSSTSTAPSANGSAFGPSPIPPTPGSTARASVYGNGTSATTDPAATGSSLFGPAPVQGGLGTAADTTNSSSTGDGLFGSTPTATDPTSNCSSSSGSRLGSRLVSTTAPSKTAANLFGILTPAGTGALTTDFSSSSALNQSQATLQMAAASNTSDATLTNETEGSALPERSVIDIVTDGDLLLEVGGDEESESSQPQRFRVSSSALSRHSPVWKNMLFGPWRESKQVNAESEQWIVELPGDPLKPMQIVLGIIHNRFSHVPPFLSLDELYKLLILTNKYDMTDVLKLWRAQWTSVAHGDLSSADTLKSLFIAWELGDANLFILRVEEISLNANFENETLFGTRKTSFRKSILAGAPVAGDAEWIDLEHQDYLGPHDMVDIIGAVRKEALLMIMTPLTEDYSTRRFSSFRTACSGRPQSDAPSVFGRGSPALCDAAILGGLMIHIDNRFTNTTMLPFVTESVVQVASRVFPKIEKIEVLPAHPLCSLNERYATLSEMIQNGLYGLVAKHLKPWHKKHLYDQRKKTGIEFSRAGQKKYEKQANNRRYW
ncbi:hypothetical protein SMACR_01169 [Sordaria macrospora]|uniref:WGS project CABT00000000 data, contig 2.2 n=2 Tax=Sordaria macrospora TaxID=5147 RepID=F7VMG5_SORMK|nr:uncharacterized protein SMAC_01169 [Sordaria macrospora k-hell]KAA8620683.1 hypothetical protein SMACR_01169 [Sordaria macrospora]KAH7630457.1 hypothetical protein B0T09DRAFT_304587 [Sordaria sp. MPI-SDFR-AT-0083]WPJ62405.1 hypothetical protein SMAC4_01169 [Sordaria macrospora]CCC07146.1 unnamed protein product [Sordaria macrospora k-hell]